MLRVKKPKDLKTLIRLCEQIAERKSDGHLSLLRFTTHWKATFTTLDLDSGKGRNELWRLQSFPTLEAALTDLIINNQ